MVKNGMTYRMLLDHLGSVRVVVDTATGTVAQRLSYGPFGEVLEDTNPGFQPLGFCGGLYDHHTGRVRFGYREYDPENGRWDTRDPQGLPGALNLYTYCHNDPINLLDVTGFQEEGDEFDDITVSKDELQDAVRDVQKNAETIGKEGAKEGALLMVPLNWLSKPVKAYKAWSYGRRINKIMKGIELAAERNRLLRGTARWTPNCAGAALSYADALDAGRKFVGQGATRITDRRTNEVIGWMSADRSRIFRLPSQKYSQYVPNPGALQANFETYSTSGGARVLESNVHITIK